MCRWQEIFQWVINQKYSDWDNKVSNIPVLFYLYLREIWAFRVFRFYGTER